MKTIENITIYKCDFCNKELKRKHAMINHELKCKNNPNNFKACNNFCKFLVREETHVYFESGYDKEPREQIVNCFKCEKLNKLMFPYSIEKSNAFKNYPQTFENQEPMPKQCNYFKSSLDYIF